MSTGAKASRRVEDDWRQVERRQWWLSSSNIVLSLILTLGILSLALPLFVLEFKAYDILDKGVLVDALMGLVLLFDIYVVVELAARRFCKHYHRFVPTDM